MQTKNETEQEVDYMQEGNGSGGGDTREVCIPKVGRLAPGTESAPFTPHCGRSWSVVFLGGGGERAESGPIERANVLVTLERTWTVSVTDLPALRAAS